MAASITWKPYTSLTDAPTNLKEAIDWVLRVTGKDGKSLDEKKGECICGLAAAVTDLLQSVTLEYNGYQGDTKETGNNKGATETQVKDHLNGLFSLVQGLGGTAVVRTYIDQLAQVLSALVGWSSIEKCWGSSGMGCDGTSECKGGGRNGGKCLYLKDVEHENKCGCMKWDVPEPGDHSKGHHLGRRCTRCKDNKCSYSCYGNNYKSSYSKNNDSQNNGTITTWKNVDTSSDRYKCARILLGSVCLIWSGITYLHWTGKWATGSPYWNNHILDGTGLDDGTLSQWLQALGFPKDMLNDNGPGNRLDAVIWDGLREKLFWGFAVPSGLSGDVVKDDNGNTARSPFGMNYAGFIHTAHRDSFNTDRATVFPKDGTASSSSSGTDTNIHKCGALFKLYILSCAYFTGLQKRTTESTAQTTTTNNYPKTIREILYWLSALPYSQAYKEMLEYSKGRLTVVLKTPNEATSTNEQPQLMFYQDKRPHPITVHEFNLFAHFQAVTQYCPLVLIGIQGGLHSPKGTDKTLGPAIHALYANSHFSFTYPTVSIQAYNQVVHYIRALFYQLYFLRKQCAVKVTCGGKWRECRYGSGVIGKDVVSWMCLGCNPMEHDRKGRVEKVKGELDGVMKKVKILEWKKKEGIEKAKALLVAIGDVVVQLGNAQEALEGKDKDVIEKVKGALGNAKTGLEKAVKNGLNGELLKAKEKLEELTNGSGALEALTKNGGKGSGSLQQIVDSGQEWQKEYSSAKDKISEAIHKVREVLKILKDAIPNAIDAVVKELKHDKDLYGTTREILQWAAKQFIQAIDKLKDICNSPKCPLCHEHAKKCGNEPKSKICDKCHQQYDDGKPSPLQAFLEDRLPGFSCDNTKELLDKQEAEKAQNKGKDTSHASDLDYPPAASHLEHCGGSGQCCPLPMGFRGNFCKGSTSDMTGSRLYGILYFFSNENMMQSCVYRLVRVTSALSATTPQVLGDVFGFFRGGVGEKEKGWTKAGLGTAIGETDWIALDGSTGEKYKKTVGTALENIKGQTDSHSGSSGSVASFSSSTSNTTNCHCDLSSLSDCTKDGCAKFISPLTGELYTAVSATFGNTYLSWVLYLSDALEGGLESLASEFLQIECRGCRDCDPNKCKKGHHGETGNAQCNCSSIVSCTGVLPVLYRHGFSYGNPFNLEGYHQRDGKTDGDYSITERSDKTTKHCHEFLSSINAVIKKNTSQQDQHPLTNLLSQVGQLQYDIRLPWIFVLTLAWLVAVLYLAFGAIWPLDWTHMRSHWLRGGEHQWQCMWYNVMTGRKGVELVEYFGRT